MKRTITVKTFCLKEPKVLCLTWIMEPTYVTSSNCVAGNAAAGAGVGPGMLHYILGITKAYCTRGVGPFPTELDWETPGTPGYHMSTVGAERVSLQDRSRRCGWFDAALLKRSAQVNSLTGLCITKLDVLDG